MFINLEKRRSAKYVEFAHSYFLEAPSLAKPFCDFPTNTQHRRDFSENKESGPRPRGVPDFCLKNDEME